MRTENVYARFEPGETEFELDMTPAPVKSLIQVRDNWRIYPAVKIEINSVFCTCQSRRMQYVCIPKLQMIFGRFGKC